MSNPFELPRELLHEVVMRTIEIDNLSNKVIRSYFGLDLKFGGKDGASALNLNEIYLFNQYFLINLGASSRANLILEIIKSLKNELKPEGGFIGDLVKFYKIRDIFAHNLFPKDLKGVTRLESSEPQWKELNEQHQSLYKQIEEFLIRVDNSVKKVS